MYNDEKIVSLLKRKDPKIVSYLYKNYIGMVRYVIRNYWIEGAVTKHKTEQEANDVFFDAIVIIAKKVGKDELKLTAKFSTYLFALSRNLWRFKLRNRIRREDQKSMQHKIPIDRIAGDEVDFTENYDRNSEKEMFWHYFNKLTKGCQKMLKRHIAGFTNIEIFKKTGNSLKYIKKRKFECKKKMIELIMKNKDNL